MTMPIENPQDQENITKDWEKVGGYLTLALGEVATGLGGPELGTSITETARLVGAMPIQMLLTLDSQFPGAAETVMNRLEEIQDATHARELAESAKQIAARKCSL